MTRGRCHCSANNAEQITIRWTYSIRERLCICAPQLMPRKVGFVTGIKSTRLRTCVSSLAGSKFRQTYRSADWMLCLVGNQEIAPLVKCHHGPNFKPRHNCALISTNSLQKLPGQICGHGLVGPRMCLSFADARNLSTSPTILSREARGNCFVRGSSAKDEQSHAFALARPPFGI